MEDVFGDEGKFETLSFWLSGWKMANPDEEDYLV